jgi:hypothetical protein
MFYITINDLIFCKDFEKILYLTKDKAEHFANSVRKKYPKEKIEVKK